MPVLASNRIGNEQGKSCSIQFFGGSFISDHLGEKIAEADRASESVLVEEIDLRRAERVVPRAHGLGTVLVLPDGEAIVWYSREGKRGELLRKHVRTNGTSDRPLVVRGLDALDVRADGPLFTVTARSGNEERSITIRRRVP